MWEQRPGIPRLRSALRLAILGALFVLMHLAAWAQKADESSEQPDSPSSILPHPASDRFWISAQDNIIFQYHPSFHAKYTGVNSLHSHPENATSNIGTLYLGWAPARTTELQLDIERASGGGIS